MGWAKAILREIYGLFVDDGNFALAVIVWLAIAWLVLPRLAHGAHWGSLVLFAGLALILMESVSHRARR